MIRTSTQVPFHVRRMVAPLLGLSVKDIRVIKPRIGGGFGAKQEMLIEDIVGHLALVTGHPVRLELNREEEFMSSRTRHPQTITYKTGVNNDGMLVSQSMRIVGNTGAYGTHGLTVQMVSGLRGLSSYNCPNKRFDCDVAYTNIPVPGAYRGYGAPQALFALESHMEDIANELGMDPLAFKRLNWTQVGDPLDIATQLGEGASDMEVVPVITSSGLEECVAQGERAIGWHRRSDPNWVAPPDRPHIRRGLGFAMCMHGTAIPGLDMGAASIKINDDGSFNLLIGATDLGTGADTVLAQMAAEVLGVPLDDIVVYAADTDMTPFDVGAYASSTTYVSGMAVKKAAEEAHRQITERAALMLDLDSPGEVELADRKAWAADGRSVGLDEVALHSLHQDQQHQIMATASYVSPESPPPYAAQFAEVEVDIETGQVTVKALVMAVDCGVPINPITSAGQVEGGMIQALGYGHCEEMAYDEAGRMVNARLGPVQDLPLRRDAPDRGLSGADHGEERAVRGQGHRRDPQGRRGPGPAQCHRSCHRRLDRRDPVHARTGLARPQRRVGAGHGRRSGRASAARIERRRPERASRWCWPPSSRPAGRCPVMPAPRCSSIRTDGSPGPWAAARWSRG